MLFGLSSVWTAIIFYFKLDQIISISKVIGMLLMIGAGVLLGIGPKDEDIGLEDLSED